jgi:hypothetical protein
LAKDPGLLAAVAAGLSTAATLGYDSESEAHDVYEAYVLTLLLEAADNDGWQWELRDQSKAVTNRAIYRRGPGRLASGNFTHVFLSKPGKEDLEAHIGVKVTGWSDVEHEFDLLVLSSAISDDCRALLSDPAYGDVVVHAEAKYYGGNLPLHLGRGMVGLRTDCHLAGNSVLVANQNGLSVEELITKYHVAFRFLIKPTNGAGIFYTVKLFEDFLRKAP